MGWNEVTAAWVQAIFSVAAILAAVMVPYFERRHRAHEAKREAALWVAGTLAIWATEIVKRMKNASGWAVGYEPEPDMAAPRLDPDFSRAACLGPEVVKGLVDLAADGNWKQPEFGHDEESEAVDFVIRRGASVVLRTATTISNAVHAAGLEAFPQVAPDDLAYCSEKHLEAEARQAEHLEWLKKVMPTWTSTEAKQ